MKKALALLLACLMVLALAACAGNTTTSSAPTGDPSSEIDYDVLPYEGELIEWKGLGSEQETPPETSACAEYLKAQYGNLKIKWDLLSNDDLNTRVQTRVAGGEIPDFVQFTDPSKFNANFGDVIPDVFLDFNQYMGYMPSIKKYSETLGAFNSVNLDNGGRYYVFGLDTVDACGENWFVNNDMLKAVNKQLPKTADEFLEVLRAVKAYDPTTYPWSSFWNLDRTRGAMSRILGVERKTLIWDEANDKWLNAYQEDDLTAKRKTLIGFLATMYAEGLMNAEIASMSYEQEVDFSGTGKWVFSFVYNASLCGEGYDQYDFEVMMPPASPAYGKPLLPLTYTTGAAPWWALGVSKKIKNPELACAFIDLNLSEETNTLYRYGIEGVHFDYVDGMPTAREGVDKAAAGITNINQITNFHSMGNPFRSSDIPRAKAAFDMTRVALYEGNLVGDWTKCKAKFSGELADLVNPVKADFDTYVEEAEAEFIYGRRPMSEWDAHVAAVRSTFDLKTFMENYNKGTMTLNEFPRNYNLFKGDPGYDEFIAK